MTITVAGFAAARVTVGAKSGAVVGSTVGLAMGLAGKLFGSGSASTVAGAVGGSMSAGAIVGSVFSEGVSGAVGGALAGAVAAAVSNNVAALVPAIASGPIGWLVVGVTDDNESARYTFDCWKPLLHDQSAVPSTGKFLRDVIVDARIKEVITAVNGNSPLPEITLRNIWDELFCIEYVTLLPEQQLAAHAVRLQ